MVLGFETPSIMPPTSPIVSPNPSITFPNMMGELGDIMKELRKWVYQAQAYELV